MVWFKDQILWEIRVEIISMNSHLHHKIDMNLPTEKGFDH